MADEISYSAHRVIYCLEGTLTSAKPTMRHAIGGHDYCSAYGCTSRRGSSKLSFHRFPKSVGKHGVALRAGCLVVFIGCAYNHGPAKCNE